MGRKSAKRDIVIAEQSEQAATLRLQGQSVRQIAAEMGLSLAVAQDRIQRGKAAYLEHAGRDYGLWVAEELAVAKMMFAEAFQAWRRSTLPVEKTRVTEDSDGTKRMAEREGQAGDPSLLAECRHWHERVCALKGLDAPKRSEFSGPSGQPIALEAIRPDNLHEFSEPELVAFISEVRDILFGDGGGVVVSASSTEEDAGFHQVHVPGLQGELSPPDSSGTPGPFSGGPDQAAAGADAAPARKERASDAPAVCDALGAAAGNADPGGLPLG